MILRIICTYYLKTNSMNLKASLCNSVSSCLKIKIIKKKTRDIAQW